MFVRSAPSAQNAVDVFKGQWASRLPSEDGKLVSGPIGLFADPRVQWALGQLGGVKGQKVLELGPLEGGHSYMLEKAGAESVLSIEANSRAFLKCLIVKEVLDLRRVSFALGDFVQFLESTSEQFDFIHSAGVLYHMRDPVRLLKLVSQHTSRTYIWTHYFDEALIRANKDVSRWFKGTLEYESDGLSCTLHRHNYSNWMLPIPFLGGTGPFSYWMAKQDILAALEKFGFNKIIVGGEQPNHPHGPNFELVARKE